MANKKYVADAEVTYNKDYQNNEYRGVVLDEKDYIVEKCPGKHMDRSNAIVDARELIDRKYTNSSNNSLNQLSFKLWLNKKHFQSALKMAVVILVPFLIMMCPLFLLSYIPENLSMGLFILSMILIPVSFIYILRIKKQMTTFGSYLYDNGLYSVMFSNDNASTGYLLSRGGLPVTGAAYALEGKANNDRYLSGISGINDILKLSEKPVIWKFNSIDKIVKINDNKYKITAEYTDHKSHKTKNINFTLVNRFDDFNELISVIQSMNAN